MALVAHSPAELGAEVVEVIDGSFGQWGAAVVVESVVAIVGAAFDFGVPLAGGTAVGVGDDVVDVAVVGRGVAL